MENFRFCSVVSCRLVILLFVLAEHSESYRDKFLSSDLKSENKEVYENESFQLRHLKNRKVWHENMKYGVHRHFMMERKKKREVSGNRKLIDGKPAYRMKQNFAEEKKLNHKTFSNIKTPSEKITYKFSKETHNRDDLMAADTKGYDHSTPSETKKPLAGHADRPAKETKLNEEKEILAQSFHNWSVNGVHFRSPESYLILPRIHVRVKISISFKIKTSFKDALILLFQSPSQFSPLNIDKIHGFPHIKPDKAYAIVELTSGHVRFSLDLGKSIKTGVKHPVDDEKWHSVSIGWSENYVTVNVDDVTQTELLTKSHIQGDRNGSSVAHDLLSRADLTMGGDLFVGGVTSDGHEFIPKKLRSKPGFEGCISEVTLDGVPVDMMKVGSKIIREPFKESIKPGCLDTGKCLPNVCVNGGECYLSASMEAACNCDMTSYSGPTCSEESIAYSFGAKGGLVRFRPTRLTDTKRDSIAFGISTLQQDAVLIRIGGLKDFIQLELIGGSVCATYNLGLIEHRMGRRFHKINDDLYHRISFLRTGQNSTLNVDNVAIDNHQPQGQQLVVFNEQFEILVGGLEVEGSMVKGFQGTIVGLVINGLRLLDLAADGDSRISLRGSIELDTRPLKLYQSFTPFVGSSSSLDGNSDNSNVTYQPSMKQQENDSLIRSTNHIDDLITTIASEVNCINPPSSAESYANQPDCSPSHTTDSLILPVIRLTNSAAVEVIDDDDNELITTKSSASSSQSVSSSSSSSSSSNDDLCRGGDEDDDGDNECTATTTRRKNPNEVFSHGKLLSYTEFTQPPLNPDFIQSRRSTLTHSSTRPTRGTSGRTSELLEPTVILLPFDTGENLQSPQIGQSMKGQGSSVFENVHTPDVRKGTVKHDDKKRTTGVYARDDVSVIDYYPTEKDSFKMNLALMIGIIVAILLLVIIVVWTVASKCRRHSKERVVAVTARDKAEAKNLEKKLLGESKQVFKSFDKYTAVSETDGIYKSLQRQENLQHSFDYQSTLGHRVIFNNPTMPDLFPSQATLHTSPSQRSKDVKEWYV